MFDRREQDFEWFANFDERTMTVTMRWADSGEGEDGDQADVERVPVSYEVCGTCDGRGSHVNPSIDSHGLSREDFDDDPDFAEDYMSGRYDVPCAECGGKRVAIMLDEDRASEAQRNAVAEFFQEQAADRQTRRMECGGW